jgi:hypothetical protein
MLDHRAAHASPIIDEMRRWNLALAVLALLLAIIVYVPIAIRPLELEPDLSLRATTHDAFARHLQFGRDLVYTNGPWGILYRGFDPRTRWIVLAVSAVLAIVFASTMVQLLRKIHPAAAVAILIGAAAVLVSSGEDARFIAVGLLVLLCGFLPPERARDVPLAAALALVALIKFSFLIIALFVITTRRSWEAAAVFVVAFVIFWLGAGQHLDVLPLFLARGFEISAGYASAASLGSGIPFVCIGAAGLAIVAIVVERSFIPAIAVVGMTWLLMKIGYVRADDAHAQIADGLLLFFGLGYLLLRVPRARIPSLVAIVAVTLANGVALIDATRGDVHQLSVGAGFSRLRPAEAGPHTDGTIDAYPYGSAALIAGGLRYAPRPVFESYMAWTPRLTELNAEHLRGTSAPEWLWVGIDSVDERYALFDDAPSWLEMMRRYEIESSGDRLLLRKSATVRPLALVPIGSAAGRFNEDSALPDVPLLWCAIDLHPTLLTRVEEIVARPPVIYIEIATADGKRAGYRAPVALLRAGFLASPHVTSIADLAALMRDQSGHRAKAIRVIGRGYDQPFTLRFSAVKTPVRASETLPVPASPRTSLPR